MDVHLHVLLHGLWGTTKHLESASRVFSARHCRTDSKQQAPSDPELAIATESNQVRIQLLSIEANQGSKTYDGIDWSAERAVEEIRESIREMSSKGDRVVKFSITGYSLGGLCARYVVAILYAQHFFDSVQPVNFVTFATPHIGIPRIEGSLFSRISRYVGSRMLGSTGKQLYWLDRWAGTTRPLLEIMADKDLVFWKALDAFDNIDIYANAIHDRMVPYLTGAFELSDPFKGQEDNLDIKFIPGYQPMMESWTPKDQSEGKTKRSLPERWEALKPLPLMGPFIQWDFPYNLIIIALMPIILAILVVLVPIIFVLNTRSSEQRVSILEKASASAQERLAQMFATLDYVGQDTGTTLEQKSQGVSEGSLSEVQRKMIANLNKLSVRKHLTWIHPVRNSHAIIICREEKQYAGHGLGEGVLRHWADHFVS
ncbi:DUF676-domain-containing protein [Lentinula raphanica]|uniref:DUF676-domain-containing protein n=1 Tax=Lentinula raphanica TaxID=153919 RepID=A0AA38PJ76_9AGAR|nr:DUF676-domain-containing protein [Lentinula raphanica]KAJ3843950.1 DUF676-domain-containing protein [Lentinula raphanica]KAJ3976135.1 DUF676-domain-containing protein [Lentinula raphanica]